MQPSRLSGADSTDGPMPVQGCWGMPGGAQCPTVHSNAIQLQDEGGHFYCDACLSNRRLSSNSTRTEASANSDENQDTDDGAGNTTQVPRDVIFNPLLAYAAYAKLSGTSDMLKNAIVTKFTTAQIKAAKKALWRDSCQDIIGPLHQRRATDLRTCAEANVLDIIGALSKLDRADRMPAIAILSSDLGNIPRAHPEEALAISIADRMHRMEDRMTDLTDLVERVVAENVDMRSEMGQGKVKAMATASVLLPLPLPPSKKKKKNKKNLKDAHLASMPGAVTLTGLPALNLNRLQNQLPPRTSPSHSSSESEDEEEPFTLVKKKRQRKPNFITGSGGSSLNSLASVDPNRHLFISGVSADTKEDDLKSWITNLNVDLKHFEKLQPSPKRPPGSTSQSFRITVSLTDWEKVIMPESWPNGIRVRRFFTARNGGTKS